MLLFIALMEVARGPKFGVLSGQLSKILSQSKKNRGKGSGI